MTTTDIARAKNLLLTTFRRDGTAVATPVWFVTGDDRALYATSLEDAGKVKRIRNNERVTIAPCTVKGRATGPTLAARARLLPADESKGAVRAVDRRYFWGRVLHTVERIAHRKQFVAIVIEPVPNSHM